MEYREGYIEVVITGAGEVHLGELIALGVLNQNDLIAHKEALLEQLIPLIHIDNYDVLLSGRFSYTSLSEGAIPKVSNGVWKVKEEGYRLAHHAELIKGLNLIFTKGIPADFTRALQARYQYLISNDGNVMVATADGVPTCLRATTIQTHDGIKNWEARYNATFTLPRIRKGGWEE